MENNNIHAQDPDVSKEKLEAEKLRLEIEALQAKVLGKEKPSRWEVLRTAIPWLGVIAPIILSLFTYYYQKEKDRAAFTYQQEKDRQEREKARDEAAYQRDRDREAAESRRIAEARQHEKEKEEARKQRENEVRQQAKEREEALKQRRAELHQRTTEAKNQRLAEISGAVDLLQQGDRSAAVSKLALYGEDALPIILGEVRINKFHIDWPSTTYAALAAIERVGVDKLRPSDKEFLNLQASQALTKLRLFSLNPQDIKLEMSLADAYALIEIVRRIERITGERKEWEAQIQRFLEKFPQS